MALARTRLGTLPEHTGETVRVCGWVDVVRDQKAVQFVIVSEPTGQVQVTILRREHPALGELVATLTAGSVISVTGEVVANERVKLGGLEILATDIEILSLAEPSPITPESGQEARMDHRHLDLRRPEAQLIFAVQTTAEEAMRSFFIARGLTELHSPKLMGSPSESGASVFEVRYFEGVAYLAQSPQFYKQMAIATGMDGVFEIAPVWRAENSQTTRHATEYVSVDVELAFIDSHEDVMRFEEEWLAHVLGAVAERHGETIETAFGTEVIVPSLPFPRIALADAVELLAANGHTMSRSGDLDPAGERLLGELIKAEHGHEFVFVTDWHKSLRPFYHMRDDEQTRSFDLLWNGMEITTGAQREHRYDVLSAQAQEAGLGSSVDYYLEFFRYGCPPHGGLGFGLARFLMILMGQPSIRETTFLFRGPKRLTP